MLTELAYLFGMYQVGKATEACEEMDELQHGQPFMPVARTKGCCLLS